MNFSFNNGKQSIVLKLSPYFSCRWCTMGEQSFILLVITVQGFCGSATLSLSTVGGNHHSRLLLTYESKAALCFIFYFCLSRYFPHVLWSYLLTWALKIAKIQNIFLISLYRQEKEPKFLQLTSFEQSFFFSQDERLKKN